MAIQISVGNLSGAFASNFYREPDAPKYYLGHGLEIGFIVMGIAATLINIFRYRSFNARKEEKLAEGEAAKYTVDELSEQGDKAVTFKYTL